MNLSLLALYSVLFVVAWSFFCFVYRALLTWSPVQQRFGRAVFNGTCALVVGFGMMLFLILYSLICLYFFSGSTVFDNNILYQFLPIFYLVWVVGLFALCFRIWKRILGAQITVLSDKKHANAWVICCVFGFFWASFLMMLSVAPPLIIEIVVLSGLIAPNAIAFVRWKHVLTHNLKKEQV